MTTRLWLALILAAYFALASLYSFTTPILETPDAVWHYAYVRELAFNHALPIVDAEGRAPYRHEGLQPPLYYAIGAVFIAWMNPNEAAAVPAPNPYAQIGLPLAGSNDNRNAFLDAPNLTNRLSGAALAVYILRFYSALLGAATVVLTFLIAREILTLTFAESTEGHEGFALLATAFVAFLPQFLFVSAAVNNDNLATALSGAVLWQTIVLMRAGVTMRRVILLGALAGLALLTKLNTITLFGLVGLGFAYVLLKEKQVRAVLVGGAIFTLLVVLIAGWWYWRNVQLYGDPTTFARLSVLVGERPAQPSLIRWFAAEYEGLRLSSWGVFGWFNILAPPLFYDFFDALALIGLLGLGVLVWRQRGLDWRSALLPAWLILVTFALWRYSSEIVSSQGRLLFLALPAWAVMWSWGSSTLMPARQRGAIQFALACALALVAAWVPPFVIAPAYAPNVLASDTLPSDATRHDSQFANGIELLGMHVDRAVVRPGESFDIAIYSRVPAGPIPRDALYIHLVNAGDVIMAQRDSFIASGNLGAAANPTLVADKFRVAIPVTVPAPGHWQVQVGIYNPTTGERILARDGAGNPLGDTLTFAALDAQAATTGAFQFDFDGRVRLLGAQFDREAIAAGGKLGMTLTWNQVPPASNYHVFVHVLGKDDHIWGNVDLPLDALTTSFTLPIDAQTPPDVYPLELGVYLAPDGDRLAVYDAQGQDNNDRIFLGPIRVTSH